MVGECSAFLANESDLAHYDCDLTRSASKIHVNVRFCHSLAAAPTFGSAAIALFLIELGFAAQRNLSPSMRSKTCEASVILRPLNFQSKRGYIRYSSHRPPSVTVTI